MARAIKVSILARPLRAGRLGMVGPPRPLQMFQSSPDPCGPGVQMREQVVEWIEVSILARPLRAGRLLRRGKSARLAKFQSSPDPCGPGVKAKMVKAEQGRLFQSSPDPCGPGVTVTRLNTRSSRCFNPRPTLAGRASQHQTQDDRASGVSILARPLRAGRLVDAAFHHRVDDVSILARPLRAGRRALASILRMRSFGFNPRPTLAGRASPCAFGGRCARQCFNPRPTLAGRASP